MKRRLFNLAALLSLILCAGCLFMWVRSGFVHDYVEMHSPGHLTGFSSGGGALGFQHLTRTSPSPVVRPWRWHRVPNQERQWWCLPRYSTIMLVGRTTMVFADWGGSLPYWLLCLGTALLPTRWWWRRRKEKRLARRGFEVSPAPATSATPAPAASEDTETSS